MKKIAIALILLSIASISLASPAPQEGKVMCHYDYNELLYIEDVDISIFESNARITFAEKNFELKELKKQDLTVRKLYPFLTRTTRAMSTTVDGITSFVNWFSEDDVKCDNIIEGILSNRENVEVFTAHLINLDTKQECTQTISLNKVAAYFDAEDISTYHRYFDRISCQ